MANRHPNLANLAPRWPKGTSGNPAGSSSKQRLAVRLRAAIEARGDAWYSVAIDRAMAGDFAFYKFLWEMIDGKACTPAELARGDELRSIAALLAGPEPAEPTPAPETAPCRTKRSPKPRP